MVSKKNKTEIVLKTIRENTIEWAKEVYAVNDKMSAFGKKLAKTLSETTLGKEDKEHFATLFSEITKETIVIEKEDDLEWSPLTAIVITKADKHNYETGKVVVTIGDGVAVDEKGNSGGFIPGSRKIVRPATEEEMKSINADQLKGLMKEVNIVFA